MNTIMNPELLSVYKAQRTAKGGLKSPANIYGKGNQPTKAFLRWNRRAIREGITTHYIIQDQLYNPKTGRFIKVQYDKRYKKTRRVKKSFEKKYPRQGSVIAQLKGDVETMFYHEKYVETDIVYNPNTGKPLIKKDGTVFKENKKYEGVEIDHEGWWYTYLNDSGLLGNEVRVIIKYYVSEEEKNTEVYDKEASKELEEATYTKKEKIIRYIQKMKKGKYNYVLDKTLALPNPAPKKGWYDKERIFDVFRVGSSNPNIIAWLLDHKINCKIILTKMINLKKIDYAQRFAQGAKHCLITPIKQWAEDAYAKAESKKGKERYNAILNKINGKTTKKARKIGYLEQYAEGIPEDRVADLCDDLQIQISIDQPHRKKQYLECRSLKKPLKHFRYINSRLDHVEHYTTQSPEDAEGEYTYEQVDEIAHNLRRDGKHFTFSRNRNGIAYVQTMDTIYKATDEYQKAKQDFYKENNIKSYEIDAIKHPSLVEFLRYGTHFNGTTDFVERLPSIEDPELRHIDIKKAYSNYHHSKYYDGFVGKITDFRSVDNYEQKGFYYIENLNTSKADERFIYYNNAMKWFVDGNIYTDAELKFLNDMGCTFTVKYGAFGTKTDFKFTEEMVKGKQLIKRLTIDKELKISYYAKCVGQWASYNTHKCFSMYGDRRYFETLADKNVKINYDEYREEATIEYPKKSVMTLTHLAGQITAYQRLLVMEQLFKMKQDKILRVCVDGIYFMRHSYTRNPIFSPKDEEDEKTFNNSATECYLSGIFNEEIKKMMEKQGVSTRGELKLKSFSVGKPRPFHKNEVWLGQGGTGKTYTNVGDKGLIKCLYIAPSWKLARRVEADIKEDSGANKTIDVNVKHRVLYMEFSDKLREKYNVFLWDEVSQYTEREKQMIFKIDGRHIFMGDIGYQLEAVIDYKQLSKAYTKAGTTIDFYKWCNLEGYKETNKSGFDNYITLRKDYRAKDCQTLQDVKLELRKYIEKGKAKKTREEKLDVRREAIEYIKTVIPTITPEDLRKTYKAHDMILCSKHTVKDEYNEMFKDVEKYLVKNNTKLYSNSEIIFDAPPAGVKAEITHGFTIHAIQGETLNDPNKLYIDLRNMFSDRMLYTAVSRARNIQQIYLIQ